MCLSSRHTARTPPPHTIAERPHAPIPPAPPTLAHGNTEQVASRVHAYVLPAVSAVLTRCCLHRWRGCRRAPAWPQARRLEAEHPTEATCTHRTRWYGPCSACCRRRRWTMRRSHRTWGPPPPPLRAHAATARRTRSTRSPRNTRSTRSRTLQRMMRRFTTPPPTRHQLPAVGPPLVPRT